MSFLASWLPRPGGTGRSYSTRAESELPLWHSTYSPSASRFTSPAGRLDPYARQTSSTRNGRASDDLVAMQRREKQLQEELQLLLDAQAEGLIAGLSSNVAGSPSGGSDTTTTQSTLASDSDRGRARRRRNTSLRGARRGIYNVMLELVTVKEAETQMLDADVSENHVILETLDAWTTKQEGLDQEIGKISNGEQSLRVRSLREEATRLKSEMDDLELRLNQMRSQHRKIVAEISEVESSVQAKLSSYQGSLSILKSEIQDFLAKPPGQSSYVTEPFQLSVPPKRRTVDLAKEHWLKEQAVLQRKRERLEMERDALEEGSVMWADVVTEITKFEDVLRAGIQNLDRHGGRSSIHLSARLEGLLSRMDHTMAFLEEHLRLAESRNWRLLACCIGAELEAFRQGRGILSGVLPHPQSALLDESATELQSFEGELGDSTETSVPAAVPNRTTSISSDRMLDTDDDEPDPELLLTRDDSGD